MKIKKIIASGLLLTALGLYLSPLTAGVVSAQNFEESLYAFLKNTDNIRVSYEYPVSSTFQSSAVQGKSKLPAHTPVIIRSECEIDLKTFNSGDYVKFSVVGDVKDEFGTILIKSGSSVSASISFINAPSSLGKSGNITINDFHTNAVDGTPIPLTGTLSSNPDDKLALSVVLSVLICPLFLLMKGEYPELPAGTMKTVYTASDMYINTAAGL